MAQFKERLKRARLSQGFTQAELANRIGVSQGTIANWERGAVRPGLPRHREELERILGLSPHAGFQAEADEREGLGAFGAWLSKTRLAKKMSVPELAQRAGISAVVIYNLEQGKSLNPQRKTRISLENALGEKTPVEVIKQEHDEQEIEGLGVLISFDPLSKTDCPTVPGVYVLYDVSDRPV
jgi:transcriptional regulator with XRE-family HTH domain